MNLELAQKVADSILYEGYLLYPYRATAVKNRQRFNFGVLLPPAYAQAQTGNDASSMRTECLIEGTSPRFDVRVRFLQIVVREAGRLLERPGERVSDTPAPGEYEIVPQLSVDGQIFQTWQEAFEREVLVSDCGVNELANEPRKRLTNSEPGEKTEVLYDAAGRAAGVLVRRWEETVCTVNVSAEPLQQGLWRVAVVVENQTACDSRVTREQALPRSLVAAHTLLTARAGLFVSLLEPPDDYAGHAAACKNAGTWPVLLGAAGERDGMLSSPIILYDHPQIAPESAGNFFDGTEIDEMLALRVMTLTDEEKREMRNVDRLAREILERSEALPQEHLLKLHGTIRGLKPGGPA